MRCNQITMLLVFLLLLTQTINAQINFEHSYPGPSSSSFARPIVINMGGSDGFKYMYVDYQTNQLKLSNLDHSNYATINIPTTLINDAENSIGYVTFSLFDCDTNMFEYAILPSNTSHSFYIYRQDGTKLFEKANSIGPYCVGCYSGAYDQRPIFNTPTGAKLFLLTPDSLGVLSTTDVYSLCGTLPIGTRISDISETAHIKAFPNPTGGIINFEITAPNNYQEFELVVFDSQGNVHKRENIHPGQGVYLINLSDLSDGVYIYSLMCMDKLKESGRFILSR